MIEKSLSGRLSKKYMEKRDKADFRLSLDLFDRVESQTSRDDRLSLLSIQKAVRDSKKTYVYLEIGSFRGGSIVPHLLDPRCVRIYSIDKRADVSPGWHYPFGYKYGDNSEEKMLENLRKVSEKDISKIECFHGDASDVRADKIGLSPDLCFIDGEHVGSSVVSDFHFCKSVMGSDGIIAFHDTNVSYRALKSVLRSLKKEDAVFKVGYLESSISVIYLGKFSAMQNNPVSRSKSLTSFRIHMGIRRFSEKITNSVHGILGQCGIMMKRCIPRLYLHFKEGKK